MVVGKIKITPTTNLVAQRAAGVDGALEADGGEEGAEKELAVGVALHVEQRQPRGRLLRHLGHRVVVQQVGQPHLRRFSLESKQYCTLWRVRSVMMFCFVFFPKFQL